MDDQMENKSKILESPEDRHSQNGRIDVKKTSCRKN